VNFLATNKVIYFAKISVSSNQTFTTLKSGGTIGSTALTSGITLNIVLHSTAEKDHPI
jgi:hypothetical protein